MKATVETKIAVIMNPELRVTIVSFGIWQKEKTVTTATTAIIATTATWATIMNLDMCQSKGEYGNNAGKNNGQVHLLLP